MSAWPHWVKWLLGLPYRNLENHRNTAYGTIKAYKQNKFWFASLPQLYVELYCILPLISQMIIFWPFILFYFIYK